MRIQRLELHGFKSFVDPTVFHLGPGIAAVVGPNGCGKSNVIDAIRWTLGEQSPGTLRGKAMADVIFSGSQGRAPANHAEVTLVFDNADGAFGGRHRRYAEIAITRRLDRTGASTYAINRQRCRLKDVVDLFVDTGVGARAYSIIEQGRVGFVVSAKPEERRLLIDEVAGVNRFKGQRGEAERRMKETRGNLVRLADLATELDARRTSLGAQARKAERFMELRDRWKESALRALFVEAVQLVSQRAQLSEALAEEDAAVGRLKEEEAAARRHSEEAGEAADAATAELAAHRERRASLAATVEGSARQASDLGEEEASLAERLERLHAEAKELANAAKGAGARQEEATRAAKEARARLAEARTAQEAANAAIAAASQEVQSARAAMEESKQRQLEAMTAGARQRNSIALLERRVRDTAEELAEEQKARTDDASRHQEYESRVAAAEAALVVARARSERAKAARQKTNEALASARAESRRLGESSAREAAELARIEAVLAAEEQLIASLADAKPGIRALVEWLRAEGAETEAGAGFLGIVADLIEVPPGLEAAVEAGLDDLVDGAVFATPGALRAAARWLMAERPGSASLVLLGPERPATGLGESVRSGEGSPGLAAQLLDGVQRVDSLDDLVLAEGIIAVCPPAVRADGRVVRFGAGRSGASPLSRRARVRALRGERDSAVVRARLAEEAWAAAEAQVVECAQALEEAAGEVHAAELNELGGRRDVDQARKERAASLEEQARAAARRTRMQESHKRLSGELARVREEAAATDTAREGIDAELELCRAALNRAERASAEAGARGTAAQLGLAEARHEAATLERDHRRMTEEHAQRTQRAERVAREVGIAQRRLDKLAERRTELTGASTAARSELEALDGQRARLVANAEAAAAARALARARETKVREAGVQAAARHAKLDGQAARLDARSELLQSRGLDEFGVQAIAAAEEVLRAGVSSVETDTGPGRPPVRIELTTAALTEDPRALSSKAARLAKEADALGAVNMAAAEEYADVDERWRALEAQRADLDAAMADLRRAIRTIEQETRERFRSAFDAVSQRFAALYPRLVGGGKAELLLTEPEDLLATGVEIRVEPPGKRLQNLQLLSGGEKAMAAIAFVFAIFEVKPSPFCLLDEVDAPLDDANSRRFNSMLGELSATTQFVVITHNRTTMEVADVLYGVTMQTAGVSSVVSVQVDAPGRAGTMRGPGREEHP